MAKEKNLKDMSSMFQLCVNLLEIDISSFDTSNAISIENTFLDAYINKGILKNSGEEVCFRSERKCEVNFFWCY